MNVTPPRQSPVWIEAGQPLPDPATITGTAAGPDEPRWPEGLVAAGHDLSPHRLLEAYGKGIFPWYAQGQPVLWWSPDPRMVLPLEKLRVRRSLQKTMRRWAREQSHCVTLNAAFKDVMTACAAPRDGESGTWITPAMQSAYVGLHRLGNAHSIEVWQGLHAPHENAVLVGGLYGVSIGRMFFGESMFARETDASKVALVALVAMLRERGFAMIDCQQNTKHLESMGAVEISRASFLAQVARLVSAPAPDWCDMMTNPIPIPAADPA